MSQSTETIDELRARIAGLAGPARIEPLGNLAQKLFHRVMNASLESPSARADLEEAIRCTDEIYGYHREGDPQRAQVAAFLAFLLSFQGAQVQGGSAGPRAVALFDEAIADGRFPVSYLATLRVLLAMQLINGSQERLAGMTSLSPVDLLAGQRSPAAMPDIDRAEELLRTVLGTAGVSRDLTDVADLLRQICEMMKALVGLGTGQLDLSAMLGTIGRLADLQKRLQAGGSGFLGMMRNALGPGAGILDLRPDERPVIIMEDGTDEGAVAPTEPTAAVAPPQPTASDLLRSLVALLNLERDGHAAWDGAARLLLPDSAAPDVDTVDNAVAMASEVVEGDDAGLSEEDIALAHFLYATALCLRQRADSAGDGTDGQLGARALLSAVRALPADHPHVPLVLRALGAFLAPDRPLAGLDTLAAGFTGRLDAVLATGNLTAERKAELHALRCACRAAFAAAELRKAVEGLPAGYPWPVSLKAASQLLG